MSDVKYPESRKQGDQTIELVQSILGRVFFRIAGNYEDMHHNTDLYFRTQSGEMIRFAMRMRTVDYLKPEYKHEFSLCCYRAKGGDAEYQKIMGTGKEGKSYGNYMIYGFQDKTGNIILFWVIIDLIKFRDWKKKTPISFHRTSRNDEKIGDLLLNNKVIGHCLPVKRIDSKTGEHYNDYFYVYDWREIPDDIIITDSEHWR